MKEVSKTCDLKTLKDSPNATSSQASAYGHMPCEKQDGLTTDLCGQEVVLANLSARQAKERGLLTSGTYGPRSTTSSASVNLSRSLASKLRQKTVSLGSTLYRLTWKDRVTPGGLPIPALRASVLRTSGKDYTGWPTPRVGGNGAASSNRTGTRGNIEQAAWLAGWPTPTTTDHKGGYQGGRIRNGKLSTDRLDVTAQISGWPTPCASKTGKNSKDPQRMKEKGRQSCLGDAAHLTIDTPARLTATGEVLTGSSAGMESGGQLNPEHSRWLMGLPIEWGSCGAMVTPLSRRKRKRS